MQKLHKMNEIFLAQISRSSQTTKVSIMGPPTPSPSLHTPHHHRANNKSIHSPCTLTLRTNGSASYYFFFLLNHTFLLDINRLVWPHACNVAVFETLLPLRQTSMQLRKQIICPLWGGKERKTGIAGQHIVLLSICFLTDKSIKRPFHWNEQRRKHVKAKVACSVCTDWVVGGNDSLCVILSSHSNTDRSGIQYACGFVPWAGHLHRRNHSRLPFFTGRNAEDPN